jgi:site-specific DNA-methyltransferase (adenine-specific)
MHRILTGDCVEQMKSLPDNSVDSVVTDPPYGLGFMGKEWDIGVPAVDVFQECIRVLKPGGHLLAFGGTRTYHRLAVAVEDAGFEIRDMIAWVYGSGFPKSHNLKGEWEGWGTALKPAHEPIVVARKPFKGTVANNVLEYGTGAINVDGCRVGTNGDTTNERSCTRIMGVGVPQSANNIQHGFKHHSQGRWPANLIHDGSDEVTALFPQTGASKAAPRGGTNPNPMDWGNSRKDGNITKGHDDNGGSAARFFYVAKASKRDRDEGCEGIEERLAMRYGEKAQGPLPQQTPSKPVPQRNHHPTVKPTDLMRYLVRLVTPPKGTVLDPFMGSGSTGKACAYEGFDFIGIEKEPEYVEIARARIEAVKPDTQTVLF